MTAAKRRSITVLLLIFMLMSICSVPVYAANTQQTATTIKVAFYPLDGFFEYDENGKECGYGVDYLNELKKYANIEWEYIPVDSWEGISALIVSGEADIQIPVSEPTNPSGIYSYTVEPVLPSYHAILTRADRTDLYYQDYPEISKMSIGISENLLDKTGVSDYLDSIGVLDNLVYYDDYNTCRAALDAGEIDGLISNIMDLTDDLKILDKFCVTKNYIITLKNSPYYTLINNAMTQLALENPSFQTDLYERYFPDRAADPFTKAETAYIEQTEQLTVAVFPDRKPVSYYDTATNSYKGIAIDLANELSKSIGIPFEYIPITTEQPRDMLGTADLVMPVAKSNLGEDCFVTASILDSEILFVLRDDMDELSQGAKVGVLSTTLGIRDVIAKQADFELIEYSSSTEAMQALQKGKIDAFANASYVINWLLENPRYSNLHALRYQSLPLEYELCGKAENTILQSILTKGIHSISSQTQNQIIKENTTFSMEDLTLSDHLYIYRYELLTALVGLLLLITLALFYNHTRSKYIREIERRGQEQEKANRAKSDFLARMSHDMRTPMNGILGLCYIMEEQEDIREIKAELPQLRESGKYLLQLINDVLDVNKVESGKIVLHPQPCDEEQLFSSIISMIQPQIEKKSIDFHFEKINIEWTYMLLDEQRVKQIFVNLLSNAVKFTPSGGRIDFIMELVSQDATMIRDKFIIRDSGIGMAEDFLPHVFEPFAQENRVHEDLGGTGLGLSIVKSLVELMGGCISVKSELNAGSEFTLYLNFPLTERPAEAAAAPHTTASPLPAKLKILLCEDHPLNAQIAVQLLRRQGADVIWKENGQLGVDAFAQSAIDEYDVVLMDIRMPILDGVQAAKAIRALPRPDAARVPIIAMTANVYQEDIQESLDAGMNAHLAKPIEPAILYQTIANALQ